MSIRIISTAVELGSPSRAWVGVSLAVAAAVGKAGSGALHMVLYVSRRGAKSFNDLFRGWIAPQR